MICKECGADNREGLPFCANCGAELKKKEPRQGGAKKKLWLIFFVCAVLVLGMAVLLTCLLSPKGCEKDARNFVRAVLKNDMQTVQELMVPAVYEYAGSSLDMGRSADSCRVRLEDSKPMNSVPLLEYNQMLIGLGSERKMTEAICIDVSYRAKLDGEKIEGTVTVVMGKIGEKWQVITLESP